MACRGGCWVPESSDYKALLHQPQCRSNATNKTKQEASGQLGPATRTLLPSHTQLHLSSPQAAASSAQPPRAPRCRRPPRLRPRAAPTLGCPPTAGWLRRRSPRWPGTPCTCPRRCGRPGRWEPCSRHHHSAPISMFATALLKRMPPLRQLFGWAWLSVVHAPVAPPPRRART